MPKIGFFLKKRMEGFFVNVLEFRLSFNQMQNTSPLMCTKFRNLRAEHFEIIQAFHTVRIVLYIGCSGPVVEDLNKINMLQSTTLSLGQLGTIFCALVDCNQHMMTALFEYRVL